MDLVSLLAARVADLAAGRDRVLVGLDGPDAAGKTTLADRLAAALPVPVVRASIDGFHRPREDRLRRGADSPEGYYRDSFDYRALLAGCLVPFRDGAPTVHSARYDFRTDRPRDTTVTVPARAVLVFDGVFLLRPELRPLWTLSVYLRISPAETLRRALVRDRDLFASAAETDHRYRTRYLPGQALYRAEADPEAAADVLVDNEDPTAPRVVRQEREVVRREA